MPRYVILTHDHPFLHWDLMLEFGDTLRSWRLLEEPAPDRSVPAERLPDHRMLYLDYEGSVSGSRGHVTRWDAGTFETVQDDTDSLRVVLHGRRFRMCGELQHTHSTGELRWDFSPVVPPESAPG